MPPCSIDSHRVGAALSSAFRDREFGFPIESATQSKLLSQGRFSPTKRDEPSFISTLKPMHFKWQNSSPKWQNRHNGGLTFVSTRPTIRLVESPHGVVNKESYVNLDPRASVARSLDNLEQLGFNREKSRVDKSQGVNSGA